MEKKVNKEKYSIIRYPSSDNKSLRAWNAADEYILTYLGENSITKESIIIYNDRFGYLTAHLAEYFPQVIIEYKSQEKAITLNFRLNNLELSKINFKTPLDQLSNSVELAIIKIPKSMEQFKLYLNQLSSILSSNAMVICGFMTKYFTPQILEIATEYFEIVEQSLAWKKSRLLILQKPKQNKVQSVINEIVMNDGKTLQQYFGVFSANNIDYATQFLIDNISVRNDDHRVLDLASGNGILAFAVNDRKKNCEIHLIDDSYLAIESSKLNLKEDNFNFHFTDNLDEFNDNYFDYVISNPPSHLDHETNIEVSINLFKETKRILKEDGHFQLVANVHLNYKTHLDKIFDRVEVTAENKKFIIYECFL